MCSDLVAKDKDIVILRTFSKIYGMAGLRAGAAIGRPDLLEKIRPWTSGALPVTGMVAATASLKSKTLVPERRKIIGDVREDVLAFLDKHEFKYMPSVSNKFMVNVKRPGQADHRRHGEGEGLHRPRVAEHADLRARLGGHTGGDEQVQDRVPQGDGLTEFARRRLGRAMGYGWAGLLGDFSGGVIAALIALPYGLAMASLMGLPPVLGVFTSILTAPIIAALGRNPVLIGGTASATVPFIALAVRSQGVGGAAKVSIVASVIMMGFCVIRLGRHITRVPHAVVTGFSCGIGAMMLISQMDIILGVDSAATRSAGSTLAQLAALAERLGGMRLAPLLLGVVVMVAATLAARWSPRAPAPLVGVALAIVAGACSSAFTSGRSARCSGSCRRSSAFRGARRMCSRCCLRRSRWRLSRASTF